MQATDRPILLVVDDDEEICSLLERYLGNHGFEVLSAGDGAQMRAVLAERRADLVVLDLMLPREDGLQICRRLRAESNVPVIMLTARGEDLERVAGLETGADDYVVKPFEPPELVARIRAVLRRVRQAGGAQSLPQPMESGCYRFAGCKLDPRDRTLFDSAGGSVELSPGEFDLLMAFVQSPRRVLDRDQLLDRARGRRAVPFDRSIDVQVSRLRKKIDAPDAQSSLIRTVRGAGYIFTARVSRG